MSIFIFYFYFSQFIISIVRVVRTVRSFLICRMLLTLSETRQISPVDLHHYCM